MTVTVYVLSAAMVSSGLTTTVIVFAPTANGIDPDGEPLATDAADRPVRCTVIDARDEPAVGVTVIDDTVFATDAV